MLVADLPLGERFAYIIGGMQQTLALARRWGVFAWVLDSLIWNRLSRTRARFLVLLAQFRAGTLKATRPRSARTRAAGARAAPAVAVPRKLAWLLRLQPAVPQVHGSFAGLRCHLEPMLEDAELKALLAAAPQVGRLLRPLCHMLGIKPTAELRLPRREHSSPRLRSASRPKPQRGEGEVKQVDVTKLSSVAYGNLIHPEREPMGWRPPNRIGYARPKPWPK